YSTYARTVRLTLEEKGVAYALNEVDILTGAGHSPEHLGRQPWGKVPAFEHDGFMLFETFAICRYIDEGLAGPALQPADVKARARMTQICDILDNYGYGAMVGKVFWQGAVVPLQGGTPDQAVIEEGLAQAGKTLDVIEGLAGDGMLCGAAISLADLHLVPIAEYFGMIPAGAVAWAARPKLAAWWARIATRPSVVKTRPSLG
ncbi:MAG: glutathione S-transferase family protein, partial [Roseococcus sp.]